MANKAVPKEKLMEEAYKLADKMKEIDPLAVRFVKRSFWRAKHLPYSSDTIELEIMESAQVGSLRRAMGTTQPTGIDAVREEREGRRG